ncbi:MAG TPA: aldehyde dehydrogenase [Candidatus Thioglobus sp.]|jgi:gamma-glutamyl-gamma-aminobutyraldehyde dehydrogenase|nr:aldehyde dehydrogenase [Candidatus Thioglobus sp.]|tara:strand:+ start:5224 stop:6732 length:1509 start_codon:yes stop_codon:yes gene_type:complete
MANLLSKKEYRAIASKIKFPVEPFIDGKFQKSKAGRLMETINPATGSVLTNVTACDEDDVNFAVEVSRRAFNSGEWACKHPSERKAVLLKLAQLIEKNQTELAVLESLESGKPISECELTDLPETIVTIQWHAEAIDKIYDQISPANADAVGLITREPLGVVGCVLPWNFPLMMLAWKIAPALAGGNSVIVKPAEQTSMTALRIAELAIEAGIPPGVLNILPGEGPDVGEPMGRHQDIDAISFTGSTEVGRLFLEFSGQSNLKKIILECGGKNPAVVLSDANNLDGVAEHVVFAALWNMGQNCTANSRLIVHSSIKDTLLEKVREKMTDWNTGDPLDPDNQLGAIISREQYDKILGYIEIAKEQGAELIEGGNPIKSGEGLFIEPTLFAGVTPEMVIAQEEVFGPVFAMMVVDTDEEAIKLANDTCYGLQASLYTSSVTKAHKYGRALQAGTVSVNCYGEGDISTPFGGYKLSGFGGRDNSLMAHDQYTETKTLWIDISEDV